MERSESGAPIYRHKNRERDFEFAIGDSENIEKISDHIQKHVGPVATVFHEMISDLVHIDIHIVEPRPERNFYTLVTSGMSDQPMAAPQQYPELRYSELLICLPPAWPMSQADWEKEENYWPVRLLKYLARFPHEYQTWLWAMHSIPHGDPALPYAGNTRMSSVILLPPVSIAGDFYELKIDSEKTIHFHALIPLHAEELALKLKKGAEALFDHFDRHQVSEILDPGRASTVAPKSWFQFWKS